jgi:hypothetical protein
VRQGSPLSPALYAAFINGLLVQLRASGLGVWERTDGSAIGGDATACCLSVLAYADDLCLLANSREELDEMLRICEAYARRFRFRFKPSKSEVFVFIPVADSSPAASNGSWRLEGLAGQDANLRLHDPACPLLGILTWAAMRRAPPRVAYAAPVARAAALLSPHGAASFSV